MAKIKSFGECEQSLREFCEKSGLDWTFYGEEYPITLCVEKMEDPQLDMLVDMLDSEQKAELSGEDSELVICYNDDYEITYTFNGSVFMNEKILEKLNSHFKAMHDSWLRHFHRQIVGKQSR